MILLILNNKYRIYIIVILKLYIKLNKVYKVIIIIIINIYKYIKYKKIYNK